MKHVLIRTKLAALFYFRREFGELLKILFKYYSQGEIQNPSEK